MRHVKSGQTPRGFFIPCTFNVETVCVTVACVIYSRLLEKIFLNELTPRRINFYSIIRTLHTKLNAHE